MYDGRTKTKGRVLMRHIRRAQGGAHGYNNSGQKDYADTKSI